MHRMDDAEADRHFARHVVARALSSGARHAQVAVTCVDKREAVIGPAGGASLRRTRCHASHVSVIMGGRLGRAKLSGTDDVQVGASIQDALASAAASKHATRLCFAEATGEIFSVYGDEDADDDSLVGKLLGYRRDVAALYPAIIAREAQHGFQTARHSFFNSNGVEQQETRGTYSFSTLFAAQGGDTTSNFSSYGICANTPFPAIIDQGDQHRRYRDSVRSLQPARLDKTFLGTIIVAPEALSFVMEPLLRDISVSLGGEHWLKKPAGDRVVADPMLSIQNCPYGPMLARGRNFDGYGVATCNIDIITNGVLTSPLVDFLAASNHGLKQNYGSPAIVVQPGSTYLSEMIEGVGRGILFSQFAGATSHDMMFSGAVSGAFSIVDGRIGGPVENVMISGDMRDMLRNIKAVSAETVNSGGAILPFVAADGVTIGG